MCWHAPFSGSANPSLSEQVFDDDADHMTYKPANKCLHDTPPFFNEGVFVFLSAKTKNQRTSYVALLSRAEHPSESEKETLGCRGPKVSL